MGQHVGVFQNIYQRGEVESSEDIFYKKRTIQNYQKDVTQTVTISNSNSNVHFKQNSFIDEPIRDDNSNKVDVYNVNNSKIIPKKAWTGYQLVHLQQKRESISNLTTSKKPPTTRLVKSPTNKNMNSIYTNIISNNSQPIQISDDIEQLITMMKNHRVSDDVTTTTSPILNTCDFSFSNGSNKLLTPQHTPPSTTLNSLPEFKFSFPAHTYNIPTSARVTSSTLDSLKISNSNNQTQSTIPSLHLTKPPSDFIQDKKIAETKKNYDARINARKILPLPKPRIRKSEENNINTNNNNNNNNIPSLSTDHMVFGTDTSTSCVTDRDNTKKKLKCSKDTEKIVVIDNKRKERNWKDIPARIEAKTTTTSNNKSSTITTAITKTATNNKNTSLRTNKIMLNTTTMTVSPPSLNTNNNNNTTTTTTTTTTTNTKKTEKKSPNIKKKGKQSNNNETNKNKKNRNKLKRNEDMAPGGFLSSDVTLFDNPISDDWICLFCQYDILFSGYQETKKKNSRRRKKDNRNSNGNGKKINDQSSSSLGGEGSSISSGSSASDDDHVL